MKRNIAMEDCRNFDPYGGVCTIDGPNARATAPRRRAVQREREG